MFLASWRCPLESSLGFAMVWCVGFVSSLSKKKPPNSVSVNQSMNSNRWAMGIPVIVSFNRFHAS
jgi:hypothetical protein